MIRQVIVGVAGAGLVFAGLSLLLVQPVPFAVAMVGGVLVTAAGVGAMSWSVGAS